MNVPALVHRLAEPVAIQVATSAKTLAPRSARGFGARFDAATSTLSVVVLDVQATAFLSALESSRKIAVNLSHPVSVRGLQVKGPLLVIEEPSRDAQVVAAGYFAEFVEVLSTIGFTPEQLRGMFHSGPARWVRMQPVEMFDQTPGPTAGSAMHP